MHKNKYYKLLKKCKICGSNKLTEVLWLKDQYLSPTFVKTNRGNTLSKVKIPMTLILCDKAKNPRGCGLLQLKEMVYPDFLYKNYFYRSATSGIMKRDLKDFADDVLSRVTLKKRDMIMDIGANDCLTLSYFPPFTKRVGVEPAKNINWESIDTSISVINDYFPSRAVNKFLGDKKARIIIATAMFYDLEDPSTAVRQIKKALSPDGILAIQVSYLALMIKNLNFYDICNEHLSYYSLSTLDELMRRGGMKIIDASTNGVNGGSLRVFITHDENEKMKTNARNLESLLRDEDKLELFSVKTYENFYKKMADLGKTIKGFILDERKRGKLVIGLGASTKGNVLLQFFGINKKALPYISEKNPDKVSLRTMGTDIELISEEKARGLKPSYMLVLPWYFKEEIVKREQEYIKAGGGLLFPMPYPHAVTKKGEKKLKQ
ncbi:MAG: methyltransferase domain-containing protein [Candidatus Portnoybacteria bacterium]|nr:methyltransferase domain-containing protein [Candidatus Portnoybacteria bacterium]